MTTFRFPPAPTIYRSLTTLAILTILLTTTPASGQSTTDGSFGPYLQNATPNGILVCWRTGSDATSEVEYGTSAALGDSIQQLVPNRFHQVAITGLVPDTLYHYRATSRSAGQVVWSEAGTFRTAFVGNAPFRFAFLAETHDRDDVGEFKEEILGFTPNLIVDASDHVDYGSEISEWDEYFTIGAPFFRHLPNFGAVGNHLYLKSGWFGSGIFGHIDLYKKISAHPGNEEWYSVRYGNTEFFFLNSNWYYDPWRLSTRQISWLKGALARATDGIDDPVFKVAIHHMPIWSSGPRHREFLDRLWTRHFFLRHYQRHGLDLALTSHDAHTEHSIDGSFHELQTASGKLRTEFRTRNRKSVWRHNAGRTIGLIDVTGRTMRVGVVDKQGVELHAFSLTR